MKNHSSKFKAVYGMVRDIPKGSVATYGQISSMLNDEWQMKNDSKRITSRVVGFALHANENSKVPCHRVVDRNGRLAPNFAFNGWREQKFRLEAERVKFIDEMHVDLEKYLWQPK